MLVGAVDRYIHAQIFGALPVDFDRVELSQCLDEMLNTCFVFPNDGKIIDDQGKPNASVQIAEQGRGVR